MTPSSLIKAPAVVQGIPLEAAVTESAPSITPSRTIAGEIVHNQLLCRLPQEDFDRVAESLECKPARLREVLQHDAKPIERVFFPNGCVTSVTAIMDDGAMVEVATVGWEGLVSLTALFGNGPAVGETIVQVASGSVFAMPIGEFRAELDRGGAFNQLVNRYAQAFMYQTMRATSCNALHHVEHRCARWLLETQDRVGTSEFALSQEFLSIMLGVQRPTVTIALGTLQRAGLVHSRRGTIQVLDRSNLEDASCECYGAIRSHFHLLGLSPDACLPTE